MYKCMVKNMKGYLHLQINVTKPALLFLFCCEDCVCMYCRLFADCTCISFNLHTYNKFLVNPTTRAGKKFVKMVIHHIISLVNYYICLLVDKNSIIRTYFFTICQRLFWGFPIVYHSSWHVGLSFRTIHKNIKETENLR